MKAAIVALAIAGAAILLMQPTHWDSGMTALGERLYIWEHSNLNWCGHGGHDYMPPGERGTCYRFFAGTVERYTSH